MKYGYNGKKIRVPKNSQLPGSTVQRAQTCLKNRPLKEIVNVSFKQCLSSLVLYIEEYELKRGCYSQYDLYSQAALYKPLTVFEYLLGSEGSDKIWGTFHQRWGYLVFPPKTAHPICHHNCGTLMIIVEKGDMNIHVII